MKCRNTITKVILLVLIIITLSISVFAGTKVGKISEIRGKVYLSVKGSDEKVKARIDASVTENTYVYTLSKSSCKIKFNNGDVITLKEKTKVFVNEYYRGSKKDTSINVALGSITAKIAHRGGNGAFNAYTPTAVAGVRGTEFDVTVGLDGSSQVAVNEGTVAVGNDTGEQEVSTGSKVQTDMGVDDQPVTQSSASAEDFRKQSDRKVYDDPEGTMTALKQRMEKQTANEDTLEQKVNTLQGVEITEDNMNDVDQKINDVGRELQQSSAVADSIAVLANEITEDKQLRKKKNELRTLASSINDINNSYQAVIDRMNMLFKAIDAAYEAKADEINRAYDSVDQNIDNAFDNVEKNTEIKDK